MLTLATSLGYTTPVSLLRHKAKRLGIGSLAAAMALAVTRGCRHYAIPTSEMTPVDPGRGQLSDEELVILLLVGDYPCDLQAIRCAAQMARAPGISPSLLGGLAMREKAIRVLAHIARAGIEHDKLGKDFWQEVLRLTGEPAQRCEPALPHWSRFVAMPGLQRSGPAATHWLVPS
jgi:hypothetical protein